MANICVFCYFLALNCGILQRKRFHCGKMVFYVCFESVLAFLSGLVAGFLYARV